MLIFTLILCLFSCSKDSDLLSDYVAIDNQESKLITNIFIADDFIINGNDAIILDVLSNDIIENPDNVQIVNTTQPNNGNIVINDDKTLTYFPNSTNTEEITNDDFSYTTQTAQEDGSSSTIDTKVDVTKINDELKYWKTLFDNKWAKDDMADAISRSKSANKNQEFYFLSYYIDGLSSMWQATGDNAYLDTLIMLVENTIADAAPVGSGYNGWISAKGFQLPLWDSIMWRHVCTALRIMHQSPQLRASGYQAKYEKILAFTEKHIWERYEAASLTNFYRSRTHMASHWARIGMELYIISGKEKYKEVFDNISFGTMKGYPSNLRNQFYPNPINLSAACWYQKWGDPKGTVVQDTDHAGPVVSFFVNAYENGFYWTKEDIQALAKTLDIVWPSSNPLIIKYNLDGTGGNENPGRIHEWLTLGRYDRNLQDRIKKTYINKHLTFFGSQPLGIAALNTKILSDGQAVYPEN